MCPLINGTRIPSDSSSLDSVESERWTTEVQFEKSVAYTSVIRQPETWELDNTD